METAAAAARASSLSAGLASRSLDPATQPPGVRFVVAKHGLAAALRGAVRRAHRGEEEYRGGISSQGRGGVQGGDKCIGYGWELERDVRHSARSGERYCRSFSGSKVAMIQPSGKNPESRCITPLHTNASLTLPPSPFPAPSPSAQDPAPVIASALAMLQDTDLSALEAAAAADVGQALALARQVSPRPLYTRQVGGASLRPL